MTPEGLKKKNKKVNGLTLESISMDEISELPKRGLDNLRGNLNQK